MKLPFLATSSLIAGSASVEAIATMGEQYSTNKPETTYMIENIPMMSYDDMDIKFLRPIQPKMHQIDFSKNQRKKRRDARRSFASGNRRAFDK